MRQPQQPCTVKEFAKLARLSLNAVYTMARRGEIPVVRFGRAIRFPTSAVERLNGQKERATMSQLFSDSEAPVKFSIAQQVREAERELHFRLNVYPRRISAGKLRQDQAERQIACQRAIIDTLRQIQTDRKG